MAAYGRPGNCYLIYIISQNRGQISASAQNGTAQISEKTGQCRCYISGSLQKVNARSMLIQCTFNARSYVQCTFNVRSHVRTFVRSMHVQCTLNAFTMRTSVVMRFLCAHNASSVREIRILHARSLPAADIDSNEIYADSQSGGRPFSDECKKPAIVCRDQISMRFEDSMYIQLYISVHTTIHKPQNCCSLTSPEHSHERRKSIAGGGSESGPSPFSV